VKLPTEALRDVERRLTRSWALALTGRTPPLADGTAWVGEFPLGQPTGADLTSRFAEFAAQVHDWHAWAFEHHVELRSRPRRVHGTEQELPTHLLVPDVDTAARLVGGDWPARLDRGRCRAPVLADRYPHLAAPDKALAAVDALSDVDFNLLCRAADWFAAHDATGLTPRQVPIEGLHAKWLNTRHALLRELSGREGLGLLPPHPARIHFTYLDPDHLAAGGRHHDSATVGDDVPLPYQPRVVVISENKDTALHFPTMPGGISVEGVGRGGATIATFDWVTRAPLVVYWGDMDADGLEILDGFRAAGVPATSILMDLVSYEQWEQFGTNHDPQGRELRPRAPRAVPHLRGGELALYERLVAPDWGRHRRIEQERIPLTVAHAEFVRSQRHP
jgi:hypothetical protein